MAAAATTSEPRGVWSEVRARTPVRTRHPRRPRGIWSALRTASDAAGAKPRLAEDIELHTLSGRRGDYVVIVNPRDIIHYRIEPTDLALLRLMDGTRPIEELVVEQLRMTGELDAATVIELVADLGKGNFLDRRHEDVHGLVRAALARKTGLSARLRHFASTLMIEWRTAEGVVRWLYDHGVNVFFRRWTRAPAVLVACAGFIAFLWLVFRRDLQLRQSSAAAGVSLLALSYGLTFLHELGHASYLIHHKRRIKSAGFLIYFGSPAFFIDSSDGLVLDRRKRILQSFAGPYAELVVAGAVCLVALMLPAGHVLGDIFYAFALLNYFAIFMNLIPLLELDGYWMLSEAIDEPELRPMSLAFVRYEMWGRIRRRERLTLHEAALAAYGILGIAFTIFSVYVAAFFWWRLFGSFVTSMWRANVTTRIILAVVVVFIAGPIVRGLFSLARAAARIVRSWIDAVRFRVQTTWRIEGAELIDQLPLFTDLPVAALNDLAGRLTLRTLRPGQTLFRQGERADAFYVIRRGTVALVEEGVDDERERVVQTLGRGDAFGELGLVAAAPHRATARASDDVEMFVVDKGSFDRLLADAATVPAFEPTLHALEELAGLACFNHLSTAQLSSLLEHGSWVTFGPGEDAVRQGEPGDAFYAIASGQMEVAQDGRRLRVLGTGDFFGELALLLDAPRTAGVRAQTSARAFRVTATGFDRILRQSFNHGAIQPHQPLERTWHH